MTDMRHSYEDDEYSFGFRTIVCNESHEVAEDMDMACPSYINIVSAMYRSDYAIHTYDERRKIYIQAMENGYAIHDN